MAVIVPVFGRVNRPEFRDSNVFVHARRLRRSGSSWRFPIEGIDLVGADAACVLAERRLRDRKTERVGDHRLPVQTLTEHEVNRECRWGSPV
jgi:hypothetical protein